MRLSQLINSPFKETSDPEISGVTADSRRVEKDVLFVAIPGTTHDGGAFIDDAIAKGASVVIGTHAALAGAPHCKKKGEEKKEGERGIIGREGEEKEIGKEDRGCGGDNEKTASKIISIAVENPRRTLSEIAARFYPRQPNTIVAVTGTNGKSSTVHFVREAWKLLGQESASIGTLGVITPPNTKLPPLPPALTTPDPVLLHHVLEYLAEQEIHHLAMEASSHGIDQYRLHGVQLKAAAFTNFTRDHLDYHRTMEEYLQAKLRLFSEILPPESPMIVNSDIAEFSTLAEVAQRSRHHLFEVGTRAKQLRIVDVSPSAMGLRLCLEYAGRRYDLELPQYGLFQGENIATAVALLLATGNTMEEIQPILSLIPPVPGRLQPVSLGEAHREKHIFIDYAHTPDALEKALHVLRPYASRKLWVLFGCGGDRDPGKRPLMGEIAARLADEIIITDDNPRTEAPEKIRHAILEQCPRAKEIGDRREAITYAVQQLQQGDVLLLAGKGHEPYQIIGTLSHPFDEAAIVRGALK